MDLDEFKSNGYQILRGIIDPSVIATTRQFLEAVIDECHRQSSAFGLEGDRLSATSIKAFLGSYPSAEIPAEVKAILTGHFPLNIRLSEQLRAIPGSKELQDVIRTALDSDLLFMHMPPAARFILPSNDHAGVPPHQDITYNRHMSRFVVSWVPLVGIDQSCGGVTVFGGSQGQGEWPLGQSDGVWHGAVAHQGWPRIDCIPMEPGDVLLLSDTIVHASMPNRSNRTRFSIDYRWFGRNDTSSKHYLDMQLGTVSAPPALS